MDTNKELNYRLFVQIEEDFQRTEISSEFARYDDIKNGDVDANLRAGKRTATLLDLYAEHAAEYNFNKTFTAENDEPVTESAQEVLEDLVDEKN